MKPVRDWLLLKPWEQRDTTLVLPDGAGEDVYKHEAYEVVATAPNVDLVEVGDIIINEGAARKFTFEGKPYYACKEDEICFIVKHAKEVEDGGN